MPKSNVAYGKSYKPCPCAQIHDKVTGGNTYFTATCHSPKRGKKIKFTEVDQIRICMGGTSHGKRYSSCPYYVKNAKVSGPKHTRSNSTSEVFSHLIGGVVCWLIAIGCFTSGVEHSFILGLIFIAVGFGCISSLSSTHEKIDTSKRGKKRK